MAKDGFLCFIDFTKVFDKVRPKNLDIFGEDIRKINNLHRQQTVCMWVEIIFPHHMKAQAYSEQTLKN